MLYQQVAQEATDSNTWSTNIRQQITYYEEWLTTSAKGHNHREKNDKYVVKATKSVWIEGQEIRTFAPFRPSLSALHTTTATQKAILRLLGSAYVLGLIFYSTAALQALIAVTTVFYIADFIIYLLLSLNNVNRSTAVQVDDAVIDGLAGADWPRYTILCPLYHEAEVVPQFVKAMQALDYPVDKLQILFLTEEDDTVTRKTIQESQLPSHFQILTVPEGQPRTKPRACNFGLLQATGDYVVIFDAEDVPDPLQLKKAVLTFAQQDEKTACVQAKLNFYNPEQNILTRWFTAEYSSWFDVTLPGLQRLGAPLPLGGTSNHFRADVLRMVSGWDPFNVTEDCDLGLRLGQHNLRTVVVDSTTYEEANSHLKNWMRQRSRWIKGYMQTYLVHMRSPLNYLRAGQLRQFLTLQLVIGGKTAILLINPLMWMLVVVYLSLYRFVFGVYHTLYSPPILYLGSLCLILGNFTYIYISLIGCFKRGHFKLIKWTLLIPLYWVMGSIAAYIALYQLIFTPHYWEKTVHGLHLRKTSSSSTVPAGAKEPQAKDVPLLTTEASQELLVHREQAEALEMADVPNKLVKVGLAMDDFDDEPTEKLPAIRKTSLALHHARDVELARDDFDDEPTEKLPAIRKTSLALHHTRDVVSSAHRKTVEE